MQLLLGHEQFLFFTFSISFSFAAAQNTGPAGLSPPEAIQGDIL